MTKRRRNTILKTALGLLLAAAVLIGFFRNTSSSDPGVGAVVGFDFNGTGLTIENDYLQAGSQMVFSSVASRATAAEVLRLKNTTDQPIKLTKVTSNSSSFSIGKPAPINNYIQPGATVDINIAFTPHKIGVLASSVKVTVLDGATYSVPVRGLNAQDFEGNNEPNLQQIFDALAYKVNVDMPKKQLSIPGLSSKDSGNAISTSHQAVGDEVLVPTFERADTTAPVNLIPLASYVARSTNTFGWFGINRAGSKSDTQIVLALPGGSDNFGGQNQQLLPGLGEGNFNALAAGSATSFTPEFQKFGIWEQDRNLFSEDDLNDNNDHEYRIYPAVKADGTRIANAYLVADDTGTPTFSNYDYQDAVFLITNVEPATN